MSPRHWSPSANFLPSFICSDKLTSLSIWFAQCNKGGKNPVNSSMNTAQKRGSSRQRLKWGSKRGTLRQPGARRWAWFPLLFGARMGIHSGRARLSLCVWSPAAFARPCSDTPCTDLPPLLLLNPIRAHSHMLDRQRRHGQVSPLPNSSQESLFSLLTQPHTVAPGHIHTRPQHPPSLDRS